MSNRYPSVGDPDETHGAILEAVRALKNIVDVMAGHVRPARTRGVPLMFVEPVAPVMVPDQDIGAFWINTGAGDKLFYWTGRAWAPTT